MKRREEKGTLSISLGIDCSVRDLGPGFLARPSGPLRVPARCISRRGFMTGIVKEQPLRKMTSAAYTVGRHSISDGFAVDCQVSAFFAATAQPRVLPDEESRTSRFGVLVALTVQRRRYRPGIEHCPLYIGRTRRPGRDVESATTEAVPRFALRHYGSKRCHVSHCDITGPGLAREGCHSVAPFRQMTTRGTFVKRTDERKVAIRNVAPVSAPVATRFRHRATPCDFLMSLRFILCKDPKKEGILK